MRNATLFVLVAVAILGTISTVRHITGKDGVKVSGALGWSFVVMSCWLCVLAVVVVWPRS